MRLLSTSRGIGDSGRAPAPGARSAPRRLRRGRTGVHARRLAVVLVLALAFLLNAAATWRCWGDLIIDTGRELDTPKQLAEGKMLYRDVRYPYGPLAPYFHALLYRLFGVRLEVLTTAGLVLAGLLGWECYRLLRQFIGRGAATAGAAAVLTINGFGYYRYPNIFNFVLPHSYPAVYGTLLGLASVDFLLRHLRRGRDRDFLLSCGLLGLVALCKLETLAATLAAHLMFLLMAIRRPHLRPRSSRLGYLAAIGIPLAVFAYFRVCAGAGLWRDNLFLPGNVSFSGFVLRHSGLSDPAASLYAVVFSLAGLLACMTAGAIGAWTETRLPWKPGAGGPVPVAWPRALVPAGVAFVVGGIVLRGYETTNVLRGLPAILWVVLCVALVRWWRDPESGSSMAGLLVLLAFAAAALMRLGLSCSAEHYGYYLTVPALLALTILACGIAPRMMRRLFARATLAPFAAGLALVMALTLQHALKRHWSVERRYARAEAQTIHAARGTMIAVAAYLGSVDRAVSFLQRQPPHTRVVVFPEGSPITFLAGCDNALGLHTFLPQEFSADDDEAGLIRRLAADPPEFVLLTTRDLSEYGATSFGVEYARSLAAWIESRYHDVANYRTPSFGVRILQRTSNGPAPPDATGPLAHFFAWQTASTLLPSGS